jgi:hypothetical protein
MFKLDVTPNITKEFLLSKRSQEEYMEFYLGVPVKKGLFCSPDCLRVDHKPTCSFYKNNKGELIFKDFAGISGNFVSIVMYLFNCSYYKAMRIIANDFNLIEIDKLEKNSPKIQYSGNVLKITDKAKIQVEIQEFSKKELEWWLSFGISIITLKKFKVFSIKSVFLNGHYFSSSSESSPIYGYFGGINSDDDELWRLYMPTKRNYRFLSNVSGSYLQGIKQLPKDGDHCIIIKSLKDAMVLYEFGFISISPTSENILISENKMMKINNSFNSNVFCFFDNDLPGVRGAKKYKKQYNCKCIFIKRKYSKDISDLYKKVSSTQFWEVVGELREIIDNKRRYSKYFYIF